MKKIITLSFLFLILNGYSQNQFGTQSDVYGSVQKFQNQFTKFGYWIDPNMPEMYILTGVAAINANINLNVKWFGTIKSVPLIFDRKAPAVRLLHIKNGEIFPVWDWITGPVDTAGFSDQSFQQWENYYDKNLNEYVNVMGSNGFRFYDKQVERLDATFHSIGGNDVADPHDAQYVVHRGDTLMFRESSWSMYSSMECVNARTGSMLGQFMTEPVDTLQSKVDALPCLDNRFLGSNEKEFYHTNSISVAEWSGDSLLVATSERHTSLIRFVWFTRQTDGTYETSFAFRLGSNSDTFNQIHCLNGDLNIQAGHDFRFIQKYNDSIICCYYDNHSCGSGGKSILFTLYPRTKEMVLLDSVRPMGDESLTSQGMGSARKILSQDRSYSSVINAPWCINWNSEYASGRDTLTFPNTIILDTFYPPKTANLDEIGSGIDIVFGYQKLFGLSFGIFEAPAFAPVLSGLDLIGIKSNIEVAPVYRCNAYLPGEIAFPPQSVIQCRTHGSDSIELYVATPGFIIEMWSTGDTTQTILVPKNATDKKYFVRGKTDTEMRGLLYSQPFTLRGSGCITTGITNSKSINFNVYPNPTQGLFEINIDKDVTLKVFNTLGVLVKTQDLQKGLNSIDLLDFPGGIYFLQGEDVYVGKIIKK